MPRLLRSEQDQGLAETRGSEFLEILARGLRVITAFSAERKHMSLSEVAAAADLPRASARRALITLEALGYVETDGRLFRLTPQVLMLASAYLSSNGISAVAQPIVERVCREIRETCSVGILDGRDVVFVARASPRRIISVDLAIGFRLPAYATATGRVLMGGLGPEALDLFLSGTELSKLTPRTIVDADVIKASVITAREQGYSVVDEEAEMGLRSAAVPVRRYDGTLVCALQVGVRAEHVSIGRMHDALLPVLKAAAVEIGRTLVTIGVHGDVTL